MKPKQAAQKTIEQVLRGVRVRLRYPCLLYQRNLTDRPLIPVVRTERIHKNMIYFVDHEYRAHLAFRHQLALGEVAVSKAVVPRSAPKGPFKALA